MMKKTLFLLSALLLAGIGASAQTVDYTSKMSNAQADWYGGSGTYSTGIERYGSEVEVNGTTPVPVLCQTITGLPAGTYEVTFNAVANNAWVGSATGDNIAQVFANEAIDDVIVYDQVSFDALNAYPHTLQCTVGVDGILVYGLQNVATGGNWYVCQGVSLTLTEASEETLTVGETLHSDVAEIVHWATTGNNGTFVMNDWSVEDDASGMKTPFCQNWVWIGENSTTTLTTATISHAQFQNLPKGAYEVSMDIRIFSEAGNQIGTGTTFTANGVSEDLDNTAQDGHEGTYGTTATEVYGTYDLTCYVDEAGTLDISIQLPTNPTYNWIAWKNLKVVYTSNEVDYSIGDPTCAASCVKPGSTVTITFPNCITPTSGETPAFDGTKSIMVGNTEVTGTFSYSGTTATVTFTMPESIEYGETFTVSVPEGLIYWDGMEVSNEAAEFTLSTPIMADQMGVYIESMYFEGMLLSRGDDYGTRAKVDRYGVPVDIEFGDDGKATVRYVDSDNYLYGDAWAYSDNKAISANPGYYTLVPVDLEGETNVYQFQGGNNVTGEEDWPMYVYDEELTPSNEGNNTYHLANNGIYNDNYKDVKQIYWKILTREERDAIKDAWVLGEYQEIAASFGATISSKGEFEAFLKALGDSTDATSSVTDAALTSVTLVETSGVGGWSIKYPYPDGEHEGFNSNANCTEMINNDGDLYQNVEGLDPGLYKVTLNGFIRHGWYDTCFDYVDYDLSYAKLCANDYEINLVPWAWEATKGTASDLSDSTPNDMGTASTAFSEGKYNNTLYTVVGEDGTLSIEIDCTGWVSSEWVAVKNLTLTYYGNPDVVTWTLGADYGTLILPFAYDLSSTGLTAYTGAISGDEMKLTEVDDNKIKAYKPYIIGGETAAQTTYYFSGTPETEPNSLADASGLTGVLEATPVETGNYVLQLQDKEVGPAFYLVTEESETITCGAYHCYLNGSAVASGVKSITFTFSDDVATAIEAVEATEETGSETIYDLSGRKVAKAQKGVYIVNGKKMVIK